MKTRRIICTGAFTVFTVLSLLFISPMTPRPDKTADYTLKKQVTAEGNRERTDYTDKDGTVTFNPAAGYATSIVIKDNNTQTEHFYDAAGHPVPLPEGCYGLLREYDAYGNNVRTTYLGADDRPVKISSGYAAEEKTFTDTGRVTDIRYYDAEGNPACSANFGYGQKNTVDADGRTVKTTYVDQNGSPMRAGVGYAAISRSFYPEDGPDRGRVKTEFYFDEQGNPTTLAQGNYGTYRGYDDHGQNTVSVYLDQQGNPMNISAGYAKVVRGYFPDYYTEMYYDTEDEPVRLSEGQYGIKKTNGNTVNLDREGNEQFSLKRTLYNHSWLVIPAALLAVLLSVSNGNKVNILLLSACMGGICYFTLLFRENVDVTINLDLLHHFGRLFTDPETRSTVLKNIWLFIPVGTILYKLYPKRLILIIPAVLSLAIELIQYCSGMGYCELSDVVFNSLGGFIGYCIGGQIRRTAFFRHGEGERNRTDTGG